MFTYDIVSPETGKVILHAVLDAPKDGVKGTQLTPLLNVLARAKENLELIFGKGSVRLALDGYEGTVFWYLLLFKPLELPTKERVSAYNLILNRRENVLNRTDLGLHYDRANDWLILVWPEAENSILKTFDNSPTWNKILDAYRQRSGSQVIPPWFYKQCADSFSWVVNMWRVRQREGYLERTLFMRPNIRYQDISVLNLAGLEILHYEGERRRVRSDCSLAVAHRVKFVMHFDPVDRDEFRLNRAAQQHMRKQIERVEREERQRAGRLRRIGLAPGLKRANAKKDMGDEIRAWFLASRVLTFLPRHLGISLRGRPPRLMSAEISQQRYDVCVAQFLNKTARQANWPEVDRLLDELEKYLEDPKVPKAFRAWLDWRDRGKALERRA